MNEDNVVFNESKNCFELEVDGYTSIIQYRIRDDIMFLIHTEVPVELKGKGVGSRIVDGALRYIRLHNYRLAPLCPFVGKYIRKHPEWNSLIAEGYL